MYLALVIFCFSTSITPGPNNLMIMMSGLNYGIKRSLAHFWGIVWGFSLMLVIVGLGLGSIFNAYPWLHKLIKICGSMYILYLAWKTITASTHIHPTAGKHPVHFWPAVLFQWANPKAWIMSVGVFATFSLPGVGMLQQVLIISAIYTLILIPSIATWLIGGVVMRVLLTQERYVRWFNWIMGGLLALSIGLMLL